MIRFSLVGGLAAGVHWLTAASLIEYYQYPPLTANPFAFMIAFLVSFCGQRHWTFAERNLALNKTLGRYGTIAALGFLINELTLWFCLASLHWWYQPSLLLGIGLAAIFTYVLSNNWVFQRLD